MLAGIPAGSVTRVRLDLMHWTGMRPSQMGRLRAEDFRLDEPIPYVADIQDLYGHTWPETTMIYTPPELAKHLAALERRRRDDAAGGPEPAGQPVWVGADSWQSRA